MGGFILLVPATAAAAASYTRLSDFDPAVYNYQWSAGALAGAS